MDERLDQRFLAQEKPSLEFTAQQELASEPEENNGNPEQEDGVGLRRGGRV